MFKPDEPYVYCLETGKGQVDPSKINTSGHIAGQAMCLDEKEGIL